MGAELVLVVLRADGAMVVVVGPAVVVGAGDAVVDVGAAVVVGTDVVVVGGTVVGAAVVVVGAAVVVVILGTAWTPTISVDAHRHMDKERVKTRMYWRDAMI